MQQMQLLQAISEECPLKVVSAPKTGIGAEAPVLSAGTA
jgi:hypothetical protein